jgi:hypothetical protein
VNCTSFRVFRAVHETANARVNHGSGAHGARFNCSKQITIDQTVVAHSGTRFSQCNHFSMGGWVSAKYVLVPAPANDLPTAHDHRSYGNFSYFQGSLRATQGFLHPEFVIAYAGPV